MKIFFCKSSIFLTVSFSVFIIIRAYWIYAGNVYKDGASIICEEKRKAVRSGKLGYMNNKKNVLFMGNSVILAGIVPDNFDSLLREKTYSLNLSLPALPVGPHYFELKDYLKNNPPPEFVILCLQKNCDKAHPIIAMLVAYYSVQGLKFPQELFSYMMFRENKRVVYNYIYHRKIYRNYISRYTKNIIFNSNDIKSKKKMNEKIVRKMIKDRGYYFIKEQASFPDNRLPPDFMIPSSSNKKETDNPVRFEFDKNDLDFHFSDDPYVKKFFDLTSQLNINVLLIVRYFREGTMVQSDQPSPLYQAVLERYSNVYMSKNGHLVKFYNNRFFSDRNHTNEDGAILYTKDIADEFKEVFGL